MTRNTQNGRRRVTLDRRAVMSTLGVAAVAVGVALVPQSSDAAPPDGRRVTQRAAQTAPATDAAPAPAAAAPANDGAANNGAANDGAANDQAANGVAVDPAANGAAAADPANEPAPAQGTDPAASTNPAVVVNPTSTVQPVGQQPADGQTAAVDIIGNNCDNSKLPAHDGFQNGNRCVSTAFGEVANADQNPSLLITSAPRIVRADRPFDLRVSTRNLVRDRFLAAAKGGYYRESSFLNANGLVRGHFHTACRTLTSRRSAPDPAPVPAFFAATEDGAGGATPDTVTVRIPGLPRGEAQCAVWAGDGSHRVPMMQRANQIPAFDVVRILVR
jgi:hypothetical protein